MSTSSAVHRVEAPAEPLAVAQPWLPPAERVLPYLQRIDEQRRYTNFGPLVGELEQRLAERFEGPASVTAVSSGTQALALALRAATDDAPGYCALPSWTFVATAHAALLAGLKPWFLDVDPETWMLDPAEVRAAFEDAPGRIGAVAAVCAFGRMADIEAWARFRDDTGVPVVLDAAAAFDALTDATLPAAVSLHATKALGAGEGGFVAARDAAFAERVRELSSFGFRGSRLSHLPATNAKMSEYAAAVGLASLDGWPSSRLRYLLAAQRLRMALIDLPEVGFQPGWGLQWVSSVCVVALPEGASEPVAGRLKAAGIDTRRWWGEGCHANPAFSLVRRQPLPATRVLAESTLGLPFAIDLEPAQAERIAEALAAALKAG